MKNLGKVGVKKSFLAAPLIIGCLLFFASLASNADSHAEILENFDGHTAVSSWWANDPSAPYVYTFDFANTQFSRSGNSLKVIYDKSKDTNTYSAFAAAGNYNLKNYDYLSFWVYNDGSPLQFRIRLEDANGAAWESEWANIQPQMVISSAGWENLAVDLTRTFSSNIDMSNIRQIIFMVQPGAATGTGTFWMDDIAVNRAPNSAPLDILDTDFYGWSSGAPFTLQLVPLSSLQDFRSDSIGNHCLQVTWGPKTADYSNFTYMPVHDSKAPLNRVGNYPNFTLNGNHILTLWVKSTTNNNIPILLKFDSSNVSTQTYTGGGNWQQLSWDYSSVTGASNVGTVYFMVYPGLADNGGTMYIDDLNLTGGTPPAVPAMPTGFRTDATNPNGNGIYTVSWNSVDVASGYDVQEAQSQDFTGAVDNYTTNIYLNVTKNPQTQAGTYYYRVRSKVTVNGVDNYGTFTKPLSVTVVAEPNGAKNDSYQTTCAEYDNINVPIYKQGITAYRITATHPTYVNTIGPAVIWTIGTIDGSNSEFQQSGFNSGAQYCPLEQPVSQCPEEMNNDWMNDLYLKFTTTGDTQTNLGATFTINFAGVNGTLQVDVTTWNGSGWVDQGSRVFSPSAESQSWTFPDGTWQAGTDSNNIHLHVVTAAQGGKSTSGAWGQFDQMELVTRALLNNRGADWSGLPKGTPVWTIGTIDGSNSEFQQSGFNSGAQYCPLEQPVSQCPEEMNNDWMNDLYLKFTTQAGNQTNLGGKFTVDFAKVNGTLQVDVTTWNGNGWTDQGSKVFTPLASTQTWTFPDGSWLAGSDSNNIHLHVVTAAQGGQSTAGAWAQFDQMQLTTRPLNDNEIFMIGAIDGSNSEFQQSGFKSGAQYNPQQQPSTQCPEEMNNDWMNDLYLVFTTADGPQTSLGGQFTINFAGVSGTLQVDVTTWNGKSWTDQGNKLFSSSAKSQTWTFPDGSWLAGSDSNNIHLHVVTAAQGGQSTAGAWAQFDQMQLMRRNTAGDNIVNLYSASGNIDVCVAGAIVDGWWRSPKSMTINIVGGGTLTGAHYLQFYKKVPGTLSEYQQVFVLYEDGNARILPLPKDGEDWIPFGASVIIGPAAEAQRPFADISQVTVNPQTSSMDITYSNGTSAHLVIYSDRTQTVVDVSGLTYDTITHPFATLRSMWVNDGNSDVDNIRTHDGSFPINGSWDVLDGNWWLFSKAVPSYHNTLAPDIKIEAIKPSSASLTIQADTPNSGSGYQVVDCAGALDSDGKVISMSTSGGTVTYNLNLSQNYLNAYLLLRYSDATGGNAISVYLDRVLKTQLKTTSTGTLGVFDLSPFVSLGNLVVGSHQLQIVTSSGTNGLYLDQLSLVSYEIPRFVSTPITTYDTESPSYGSGYQIGYESNATDGRVLIMVPTGGEAFYNINLANAYQNCHVIMTYSQDVPSNAVDIYIDGALTGKFPSVGTGGGNSFVNSPDIYLGNLTAGAHQVRIVSENSAYGLDLDQFALVFYAPFKCVVTYVNPDFYLSDGTPAWYIGSTMHYNLYVKNLSSQPLSSLNLQAIQEYYESGTGYNKGEALPGSSTATWNSLTIGAKSAIVFDNNYYYIPQNTYPGLDQTHLSINQSGFVLYNDPEAGIWCPP